MPVTEQQIFDIQAENFAEDVEILPEMTSWTIKQVEEYFVTCGEVMPDANEAPPAKEQEYVVIYNPRIAIRKEATADGAIVASLALGTKVPGTPFKNDVGEWIKLSDGRGFSCGFAGKIAVSDQADQAEGKGPQRSLLTSTLAL